MEEMELAGLEDTTREGYPTLWGQGEMAAYADIIADQTGQPRLRHGRTWTWDRLPGFPSPVARLQMGNVYLADEMRPWIINYFASSSTRRNTAPTSVEVREAILADQEGGSVAAVAARHGVSPSTAWRILQGRR